MIERRRPQGDVGVRSQDIADPEIMKLDLRLERVEADGKKAVPPSCGAGSLEAIFRQQVSRPQPQLRGRHVTRGEERYADDMIDVAMTEENIGTRRCAAADKRLAERTQSRAGIKDEQAVPAPHLDAGGVSAVAGRPGSAQARLPRTPQKRTEKSVTAPTPDRAMNNQPP